MLIAQDRLSLARDEVDVNVALQLLARGLACAIGALLEGGLSLGMVIVFLATAEVGRLLVFSLLDFLENAVVS